MSVLNGNNGPADLPGWLYRAMVLALLGWQVLTTVNLDKAFDTFAATTTMTLAGHEKRLDILEAELTSGPAVAPRTP